MTDRQPSGVRAVWPRRAAASNARTTALIRPAWAAGSAMSSRMNASRSTCVIEDRFSGPGVCTRRSMVGSRRVGILSSMSILPSVYQYITIFVGPHRVDYYQVRVSMKHYSRATIRNLSHQSSMSGENAPRRAK